MQGFSWKLALFYLTTIGLAVWLFSWVTKYGETNLKAQPKITGQYDLKIADMPSCMQGSALELQQSGRYLNAVILSAPDGKTPNSKAADQKAADQKATSSLLNPRLRQQAMLNGTWWHQLELAGTHRQVGNCFVTAIAIQAQVKPGGTIVGQLQLNQKPSPDGLGLARNWDDVSPANVLHNPTYNNGNPQTLTFSAEKR
jgi:hypothetical protein